MILTLFSIFVLIFVFDICFDVFVIDICFDMTPTHFKHVNNSMSELNTKVMVTV